MFIPEFWVGFATCIVLEVVLVTGAAIVSYIKSNSTKDKNKEDKQ